MGEVILTMKDIDKSFPGVHALDHVNFEVKRGEVHALMGENGAGKSTLIKTILHEQSRYKGAIYVDGIPVKEIMQRHAGKSDMYPRTTYFLKNVRQCKMQKRWAFFMMISG